MSIKRKYISVDAQSKESLQEVRLTNQANVLHAQEIRLTNPETQQMDDISNIFFNKQDGQQIAETIKDQVKESVKTEVVAEIEDEIKQDIKQELQGEYLTVESAGSMFISKDKEGTFATKTELSNFASKDDVRTNIQLAMQNVEDTYLTLSAAEEDYATKNGMQTAIDDVKTFVSQTYLKKEDAGDFALKSELEGLASEDHVQSTVQTAMEEVENTYLRKANAEQLATKEELQSAEQSIESSIQQNYLSIEDASTTYLSQTAAASLASKSEVTSAKQEVLGQVDGTYAKKEEVQKVVLSGIEDIDLESEYTLTDVAAKINEILAAFRSTGSGGGNEPTVNPDPGEGGGEEGSGTGEGGEGTGGEGTGGEGEGNEPTGGNDEPSSGNEEPSQGETPSQSDPERDPAKTRVIYTEESGIPRSDRDIVGELTNSSIPNRGSAKEVYIGNTVTSIGGGVFDSCSSLAIVTIPNSVTSIRTSAFSYCSGLMEIIVESGNSNFITENGLLLSRDGKMLIKSVNDVITIPNSVTNIVEFAFSGCDKLTSVTIPNSVTSIGYAAFAYCFGLTSMTIPNNVTSIGDGAFAGTNISTMTILGKPTIDSNALNCHISTLNVPEFTIDEVQNSAVDWGLYVGCVANCKDGVLTLA